MTAKTNKGGDMNQTKPICQTCKHHKNNPSRCLVQSCKGAVFVPRKSESGPNYKPKAA